MKKVCLTVGFVWTVIYSFNDCNQKENRSLTGIYKILFFFFKIIICLGGLTCATPGNMSALEKYSSQLITDYDCLGRRNRGPPTRVQVPEESCNGSGLDVRRRASVSACQPDILLPDHDHKIQDNKGMMTEIIYSNNIRNVKAISK
jgi:hypothetical protein